LLIHARTIRPAYLASCVELNVVALWMLPPSQKASPDTPAAAGASQPTLKEVHVIVERRCVTCHAREPDHPAFAAAPLGMTYDTPGEVERHKEQIKQVVASGYMPLGNMTGMTEEERETIAAWEE
jgi:uncharacterized membrane protein